MNKIKLILADDHNILLNGLNALITKQKDMEVIGCFQNGQLLYDAVSQLPAIDMALIDIDMPVMNGHQLTLKLKENYPNIRVVILSMHDDASHIMDLVESGIAGYLLKNANDTELLEAIRTIMGGRMYFSPEVGDKIEALVKERKNQREAPPAPKLTDREVEILKLIAQEFTNAQIADTLFISERTVETHRKNMLRKTDNKSIIGLIKFGMEQKII